MTKIQANEIQVGQTIRVSACKPHKIDRVDHAFPDDTGRGRQVTAMWSGKWSIVVSGAALVSLLEEA
jgi:hypothetical protein